MPKFPSMAPCYGKGRGRLDFPCDYVIICSQDIINYAKEVIPYAIGQMPERNTMALEIT